MIIDGLEFGWLCLVDELNLNFEWIYEYCFKPSIIIIHPFCHPRY